MERTLLYATLSFTPVGRSSGREYKRLTTVCCFIGYWVWQQVLSVATEFVRWVRRGERNTLPLVQSLTNKIYSRVDILTVVLLSYLIGCLWSRKSVSTFVLGTIHNVLLHWSRLELSGRLSNQWRCPLSRVWVAKRTWTALLRSRTAHVLASSYGWRISAWSWSRLGQYTPSAQAECWAHWCWPPLYRQFHSSDIFHWGGIGLVCGSCTFLLCHARL